LQIILWLRNANKYQDETRAWRDPKVKIRQFSICNLVLLWNPLTKSSGKLESKWVGHTWSWRTQDAGALLECG
jgi:hypothetical protein